VHAASLVKSPIVLVGPAIPIVHSDEQSMLEKLASYLPSTVLSSIVSVLQRFVVNSCPTSAITSGLSDKERKHWLLYEDYYLAIIEAIGKQKCSPSTDVQLCLGKLHIGYEPQDLKNHRAEIFRGTADKTIALRIIQSYSKLLPNANINVIEDATHNLILDSEVQHKVFKLFTDIRL
jgi:hypothetical protein